MRIRYLDPYGLGLRITVQSSRFGIGGQGLRLRAKVHQKL